MAKAKTFSLIHNLDGLDKAAVKTYLDEMSDYIGLDPALNGLDTIYMDDPQGNGRTLVPYARRGTCEILRNKYGVEVESLTYATVGGSIIFTATGRAKERGNRQEVAVGSKYIDGLREKALDNAVMTASTRALQRLTMQFTELGILAESEVVGMVGQTPNLAGSAQLAENSLPPVFLPPPAVPANNAPGKLVDLQPPASDAPAPPATLQEPFLGRPDQVAATWKQFDAEKAAEKADPTASTSPVTTAESVTSEAPEAAKTSAKKTRKKANTVALDVEPEIINAPKPAASEPPLAAPTTAPVIPAPPPPAPEPVKAAPQPLPAPVAGAPTKEQMDEYRKKISVFTIEIPPSADLGPTQKMRAFITKMSGTPPQSMSVDQWEEVISFFDAFMAKNSMKSLITHINDTLGVK